MLRATRIAAVSFIAAAPLLGLVVLHRHLDRVAVGLGVCCGRGPGAGGGDASLTSGLLNRGKSWGPGRGWQAHA